MKRNVKLQVKCKNKVDFHACVALFHAMGFPYKDGMTYQDVVEDDFYAQGYIFPFIDTSSYDNEMDCSAVLEDYLTTYSWPKDFDKIVNALSGKDHTMILTPEYDARVTENGVVVGCQTITFEKLEELNKLVADYRETYDV